MLRWSVAPASPHETYVKVNGVWRYVYRAVDQHGQVIDVLLSPRLDMSDLGQPPSPCGRAALLLV
jgi:hypothetical protein